jgi:hypothetical protein
MAASSLVLGAGGIAFSFLPQEIASYLGVDSTVVGQLMLQILGALYFAFGMINWMAKGNLIGGIYGRPLAVGNVVHFSMGTLVLVKALNSASVPGWLLVASMVYAVFAVLFAKVLFTHPIKTDNAKQS